MKKKGDTDKRNTFEMDSQHCLLKSFSSQVITIALCHNIPWVKRKSKTNM